MTKLNMINENTNTRNGGARVRNVDRNKRDAKSTNAKVSNEIATIPLKTMHNDIIRDDATFTKTTKQMRVVLRDKFNDIHERNNAWMFTQSQYDIVRSHFDAKYRAKIERASKRNTKSNDAPKSTRKRNAKSNVAPVTNENATTPETTQNNA